MWVDLRFAPMGTIRIIRMRVRPMGITGRAIFPAECLSARDRGSTDGDIHIMAADFMGAVDSTDAALRVAESKVVALTRTAAASPGMEWKDTVAADSTVVDPTAADVGKGHTHKK